MLVLRKINEDRSHIAKIFLTKESQCFSIQLSLKQEVFSPEQATFAPFLFCSLFSGFPVVAGATELECNAEIPIKYERHDRFSFTCLINLHGFLIRKSRQFFVMDFSFSFKFS